MNWIILSLLSAVGQTATDMSTTKAVRSIDEYATSWAIYFYSFLWVAPICLSIGLPHIDPHFWYVLPAVGALDTIGVLLYVKALKHSDLSLTLPIQMFTPLFLLIASPLILGEATTVFGVVGVVLIIGGSYVLNTRSVSKSLFAPLTSILTEKGSRYMFMGSIVWSLTSSLHKLGVGYSSPMTYAMFHRLTVCLLLGTVLYFTRRKSFAPVFTHQRSFLVVSALSSLTLCTQLAALAVGNVVYVMSIKRTSAVLGVLVGAIIYKEFGMRRRLVGATIMVAGVFCTTF